MNDAVWLIAGVVAVFVLTILPASVYLCSRAAAKGRLTAEVEFFKGLCGCPKCRPGEEESEEDDE